MSSNDLDDLARVLAEHGGPTWTHRYGWRCGCGDELSSSTLDEMGDAIAAHAPHLAATALASGVVVSARDVRQLADDLDRAAAVNHDDEYNVGKRNAYRLVAREVRRLLREPATDTAPEWGYRCPGCGWATKDVRLEGHVCPTPATDAAPGVDVTVVSAEQFKRMFSREAVDEAPGLRAMADAASRCREDGIDRPHTVGECRGDWPVSLPESGEPRG